MCGRGGGRGGTRLPKAHGDGSMPHRCLLGMQAECSHKLGFSAALTLAFPAWTPPWAEQGFSRGFGSTVSENKLPSREMLEQEHFCQSFLANLLHWAGTHSCCCSLGGDLQIRPAPLVC